MSEKEKTKLEARSKINDLVRQAKTGSPEASEELLSRLKPLIYACIKRNFFGNVPSWEDLVQEASLSILEGVRDYNEQRGIPFLAYIKTKLKFDIHNICRSERTHGSHIAAVDKEGHNPLELVIDDSANPQEDLLKGEQSSIIEDALNELEAKHREVIKLYCYQKLTLKDTARKMGISYKTAQRYKAKAVEQLNGLLGEEL